MRPTTWDTPVLVHFYRPYKYTSAAILGAAYHWDTLVIGAFLVVNSMFGLPWLVAATVRSINHVQVS